MGLAHSFGDPTAASWPRITLSLRGEHHAAPWPQGADGDVSAEFPHTVTTVRLVQLSLRSRDELLLLAEGSSARVAVPTTTLVSSRMGKRKWDAPESPVDARLGARVRRPAIF